MAKNSGMSKGLGRGLDALLGSDDDDDKEIGAQAAPSVSEISIDLIDTNPWQPRTEFQQEELDELATSIRNYGIITPLTLRKVHGSDRFQLIAGERRFRAAKMCGLATVPAYVREVSDDKMLAVALIENIQRSNLNPIEEALSYQRLIEECNLTQETLADQVGKKRSTVANYLRLLNLPQDIKDGLRDKLISMGHARAIMGVEDVDTQIMLFHETVEQGYSVRRIEELVREYNDPNAGSSSDEQTAVQPKPVKPKRIMAPEYQELGQQLSSFFRSDVKLARNENGKGKITIPFSDDDDLLRIMELLDASRQQ